MAWTEASNQEVSTDHRGWPKNKLRRYSHQDEQRVQKIYHELTYDPEAYFTGALAIFQRYRKRYPHTKPLPLRFIGRTLSKYGLVTSPTRRRKGASRYLHYPEHSINQLGDSLLEIDFIGKKFITGRTEPINFIAFSLKFPRKLKHFQRIESETADEVIKHCKDFLKRFEKPGVVKLDNGFAFAGASPWPRTLSKVVIFLLKEQIIPVFTAPRKPWNQASVEGANSIFAKKFWQRFQFTSLEDIDKKLEGFNNAYQQYLEYKRPRRISDPCQLFVPKIYFIRKVYENPQTEQGSIEVVKEYIGLPKEYINLFVLVEWNLDKEQLTVYFENEHKLKRIYQRSFKINLQSKQKVF
jgi:hypothetical protein